MTYTVKKGDTLYSIASEFGVTVVDLYINNKLFTYNLVDGQILEIPEKEPKRTEKSNIHTVKDEETVFSIARNYGISISELQRLNQLKDDNLVVGQILKVSNEEEPSADVHTVEEGENFYTIAKLYNISMQQLKFWNDIKDQEVHIGQQLKVASQGEDYPDIDTDFHKVKSGENLYAIARRYKLSINQIRIWNNLKSDQIHLGQELRVKAPERKILIEEEIKEGEFHIVQKGETLYYIARAYKISIHRIRAINHLEEDDIYVGQKLLVTSDEKTNEVGSQPLVDASFDNIVESEQNFKAEIKTEQDSDFEHYLVEEGQGLYDIAQKFNMTVAYLKQINYLQQNSLQKGQVLKVLSLKDGTTKNNNREEIVKNISEHIRENLPKKIKQIIKNRKIIEVRAVNGEPIFMEGIKNSVGKNHINYPDDLDKVQKRLIQLDLLPSNHGESPVDIGKSVITANLIPKTIHAIEVFQLKYNVFFWLENPTRIKMMGTNMFAPGVIMPNDITYKVLRDLTQYTISFPNPVNAKKIDINFNNFPISISTTFYKGVSYTGTSNPDIPLSVFKRLGLSDALASALKYIAKNLSNFDTVNSYDNAIFSYGFIPFQGNEGGLASLLASIKEKGEKAFEQYFSKFGIDVDYRLYKGQVRDAEIIVLNPYAKNGKYLHKGQEAERILRSDKQLHGIFIRAGFVAPIITLQIDSAITAYVNPAMAIRVNLIAGSMNKSNLLLRDLISTPMGLVAVIELTIKRWINETRNIFRQAIEQVIVSDELYTEKALRNIDEKKVLEKIIENNPNDSRLVKLISKILNSKLSVSKQLSI